MIALQITAGLGLLLGSWLILYSLIQIDREAQRQEGTLPGGRRRTLWPVSLPPGRAIMPTEEGVRLPAPGSAEVRK